MEVTNNVINMQEFWKWWAQNTWW